MKKKRKEKVEARSSPGEENKSSHAIGAAQPDPERSPAAELEASSLSAHRLRMLVNMPLSCKWALTKQGYLL